MNIPGRGGRRIAAGALLALAAALASAQPPARQSPPTERLLSGLNYEAVVMVNNAARQRQSAAGRALASMLDQAHLFPETMSAWKGLAEVLDWPGDTAFDELLGRRVTLVARGLDGPGEPQWALITEVSMQTERRLRERLQAAPRGNIEGLGVLSVEDGKYELVVGRAAPPGVDPNFDSGAEPTAAVLLCPGGDSPLMPELAPSLVTRTGLAAPIPAWKAGQKQRESDVIVMLRKAGAVRARDVRFLTLHAVLEDNGWDARLTCSPDLLWGQPGSLADLRPWSDGAFRSMERDSLVACMGVVGSLRWVPPWPGVSAVQSVLPALEGGPCGQLAALVIRPAKPTKASPERREARVVHGEPEPLLLTGSNNLSHLPDPPSTAMAGGAPLLSLTLAVQSREGCRAVSQGDQAVARFMTMLGTGEPSDAIAAPAVQFEVGIPETTTRSLSLEEIPIQESLAATLRRCFGGEPMLSWGGLHSAALQASAGRSGPRSSDWWFASIAPGSESAGASVAGRDAAALLGPETAAPIRRLSIGSVHPAALSEYLAGRADLNWMRSIDSLRWDAWLGADDKVQGTISLRLRPTPR